MVLDISTSEFLNSLDIYNITSESIVNKIHILHQQFQDYDTKKIDLNTIKIIFDKIDKNFYNNKLCHFLKINSSDMNIVNLKNKISTIDAFLSVDVESNFKPTIYIELDAINKFSSVPMVTTVSPILMVATIASDIYTKTNKIYYSGGYLTKSRVVVLILILID